MTPLLFQQTPRSTEELAREFWERAALAAYFDRRFIPVVDAGCEGAASKVADKLTAEWRKRFASEGK